MTNMDKLYASVAANGPVCVGLDTEFSYLPADVVDCTKTAGENVVEFNRRIIEATKASAGCYKVQIAYYESLGLDGMRAYAETLKMVRATGLPVLGAITRTMTDAARDVAQRRFKYFLAGSAALAGLFVLLLAVEFVQRGMVA